MGPAVMAVLSCHWKWYKRDSFSASEQVRETSFQQIFDVSSFLSPFNVLVVDSKMLLFPSLLSSMPSRTGFLISLLFSGRALGDWVLTPPTDPITSLIVTKGTRMRFQRPCPPFPRPASHDFYEPDCFLCRKPGWHGLPVHSPRPGCTIKPCNGIVQRPSKSAGIPRCLHT